MDGPTAVALTARASPQKRALEEDPEPLLSTPQKDTTHSESSTPLTVVSTIRTPSPMKKTTTKITAPPDGQNSASGDTPAPAQDPPTSKSTQQPAKRRKLTPKEREQQQQEKEAKAKAKAEKKAQKELEDKAKAEQRARREEEKRERDELKRKENEEREEKRRARDLERQQKEEEKRKKERSQMKLNAFFLKPKSDGEEAGKTSMVTKQNPLLAPASLPSDTPKAEPDSAPPSPQKPSQKDSQQTDYERYFLSFSLPANTNLAPYNAFMQDPLQLAASQARMDKLIAQKDVEMESLTIESFKSTLPTVGGRGLDTVSIAEIVERVNNSSENSTELTSQGNSNSRRPLELLKQIPMKYLHFGEDVRPPYYGTYTKQHTPAEASRLARNPFSRGLREAQYDYDSEAEWEEPEEGEDLDSDGDDDMDEEGEDDMDGFLDDEEDPQLKRKMISSDLEPVSTGLCWEDSRGVSTLNDGSGAISTKFKNFRMGFLLEPRPTCIDPFSTAYWDPEPAPPATTSSKASSSNMDPPRLPLAQRHVNGLFNTLTPSSQSLGKASKAVKAKRMVPDEQMTAFKAEIEGKDLTKIGMIEALKKSFPKLPKDAITNTLTAIAKRQGPSEKEKRWILIN